MTAHPQLSEDGVRLLKHLLSKFPQYEGYIGTCVSTNPISGAADTSKPLLVRLMPNPPLWPPMPDDDTAAIVKEAELFAKSHLQAPIDELFTVLSVIRFRHDGMIAPSNMQKGK